MEFDKVSMDFDWDMKSDDMEFDNDLAEILDEILETENNAESAARTEPVETIQEIESTSASLPAPVTTSAPGSLNFTKDKIGVQSKYVISHVSRGDAFDTFYHKPIYDKMMSNDQVINVINNGSDLQVINLNNFSCQTPGTKAKCDQTLECKFFTDVSLSLLIKYRIDKISDVYKRMALLSDRCCMGCECNSAKVVCLAGEWRCHNCVRKGKDINFLDGLDQWLKGGCPTRHTTVVLPQE